MVDTVIDQSGCRGSVPHALLRQLMSRRRFSGPPSTTLSHGVLFLTDRLWRKLAFSGLVTAEDGGPRAS